MVPNIIEEGATTRLMVTAQEERERSLGKRTQALGSLGFFPHKFE
jgi:hypothetical protein